MKRKALSLMICLVLLVSLLPQNIVLASTTIVASGTCGDNLTWTLDDEGTLTISGSGDMWEYRGTKLPPWFELRDEIVSIVIGGTVSNICNFAFYYCEGLEHITVSSNNKIYHSVDDCLIETESKTLIKGSSNSIIPSDGSVVTIADSAFYGCWGLTQINIPKTITKIGKWAFNFCPNISSITVSKLNANYHSSGDCLIDTDNKILILGCGNSVIPNDGSVVLIGDAAFAMCKGLSRLNIPETITQISVNAFLGCENLEEISLPANVSEIGSSAFKNCTSLTAVDINIKQIGDSVFEGCSGLKNVYFGSKTQNILSTAFKGCSALESIEVHSNNKNFFVEGNCLIKKAYEISGNLCGSGIVLGCNNSEIPAGVAGIGAYAFYERTGFSDVSALSKMLFIDDYAFYGCTSLEGQLSVNNAGIYGVGYRAFYGCTGILGLSIGDNIENEAFYGCNNVKSVYISSRYDSTYSISDVINSNSIETIDVSPENAYYYSKGNCVISSSSMGMLVFGCKNSVIPTDGSVKYIGNSAFRHSADLKSITIPASVTTIGSGAFDGCDKLTDIYYTGSEYQWGKIQGYDSDKLKSVIIHYNAPDTSYSGTCGDGVDWTLTPECELIISGKGRMTDYSSYSVIPWYSYREGIEAITIENGIENIGDYALFNCVKVESLSIPNSVKEIGDVALCGCSKIKSIQLPSSISSVGEGAFYGCDELSDVFFDGSEKQWKAMKIAGDNETLTSAMIHYAETTEEPEDTNVSTKISYSFGQSVQIGLIEPWFLKANARVYTDTNPTNIDYSSLVDYGAYFIRASALSDKNATQESLTVEDIINNPASSKYSKSAGTATVDGSYITANYDKGLYTYELDDSVFVLFYIEDANGITYAPIRERNLKSLLEARCNDVANFPNELERAVYKNMLAMFDAISAYRDDYFSKN